MSPDQRPDWPGDYEYRTEAKPSYHAIQIRDFLQAILERREPLVSGEEGRKSVELTTAIYRSARTGESVGFPVAR